MLALRRGITSAAVHRSPLTSAVEENISRLPSGLTVASVDLRGAVSQLVLAFRAGSRYEQPDEAGLVHTLRNCMGTDSAKYLGVKLLWQSGSIGANLLSTASKDIVALQMSICRSQANVGLSLLGELGQPALKVWDVDEMSGTMRIDLTQQSPLELVVENLHKIAFREGQLGNSILTPAHRIGKVSSKQLVQFAKSRLVSSEAALVGINIDHSTLLSYAQSQGSISQDQASGAPPRESPYTGGSESRHAGNSPLAYVAIAGQGAKLKDLKSVAVQSVLAAIIGKGQNVKFTSSPGFGVVSKQVFKAANNHQVGVNALSIVHSDGGLAGMYIVAEGDKIAPIVKAAVNGLKELASSAIDVETMSIAKKLVEVETHVNAESAPSLSLDQAAQILANGSVVSPSDFIKLVQGVSSEDVKKAAAKLTEKLSISSYGSVSQVPHVDQL